DCADDRLRSELCGERGQDPRVVEGGAVDRHLVGSGEQEVARVVDAGDPAARGERDRQLVRREADHVEDRPASLEGCGDVEEDELVRSELGVASGELHGLPHLSEPLEVDALDHAAAGDVEAGDHAPLDHRSRFSRTRAPAAALRSGWNWTPAIVASSTAATTRPS